MILCTSCLKQQDVWVSQEFVLPFVCKRCAAATVLTLLTDKANSAELHITHTHTHTRTPILRPFVQDYPGGPVPERWNQSGFYWSKRQWVAVASAGPYAICTLLQTDNHASTPPLSFLQAGCPSCRPTNSVIALNCISIVRYCWKTQVSFISYRNWHVGSRQKT